MLWSRPLLFIPLLMGAAAAAGCGEDFPPFNRLTSLRVLAIQAEPPMPAPGETATLSALVYTPPPAPGAPAPTVSYAWSWCPVPGEASDGYPCSISEAELRAAGGGAFPVPSYDLGTGPTARLAHGLPPALLQQACSGLPGLPEFNCDGGFPVQVKLVVRTPAETVTTVYSLRLRVDATGEPNTNPGIDGLFRQIRVDDVPTGEVPLTDAAEVTLPRAEETIIKAAVPLTHAETYTGKNDDLQPEVKKEQLTLTWFVESGDTDEQRTRYVEGGYQAEKNFQNGWEPDRTKDYPPGTARIMVVIRDNRGGVSWRTATVQLENHP